MHLLKDLYRRVTGGAGWDQRLKDCIGETSLNWCSIFSSIHHLQVKQVQTRCTLFIKSIFIWRYLFRDGKALTDIHVSKLKEYFVGLNQAISEFWYELRQAAAEAAVRHWDIEWDIIETSCWWWGCSRHFLLLQNLQSTQRSKVRVSLTLRHYWDKMLRPLSAKQ